MKCGINKRWIEMEKEHTKSNVEAKKIVEDHIREFGCNYYPELIKMEKHLKGGK